MRRIYGVEERRGEERRAALSIALTKESQSHSANSIVAVRSDSGYNKINRAGKPRDGQDPIMQILSQLIDCNKLVSAS